MALARAYYNEIDPFAAQWLRNLISAGLVAPGDVDERSIEDVTAADLRGYTQCHFFAGIGGWSYALRLAGWPDDRAVWTGSCPCQPFSAAGKGKGFVDERHLWPSWHHLIRIARPDVVFGEQVEAAIKHGWLDLVQADLEGEGYRFGVSGVPAAGVGAPHGRARLWFVADTAGRNSSAERLQRSGEQRLRAEDRDGDGTERVGERAEDDMGNPDLPRPQGLRRECELAEGTGQVQAGGSSAASRDMEDPQRSPSARLGEHSGTGLREQEAAGLAGSGSLGGWWRNADWLWCRDEKYRPVESGTFPLAHGVSNRVGRLRGYGNAIVPQVAAEVIRAYMEIADEN